MFPDGASEGLYHTADATLWFFHAVQRYLEVTGDARHGPAAAAEARRRRRPIICRARGSASASTPPTACCGRAQPGYQLTWMDAKVDDWVVTPRRGKAVEINALWYNALRLLDGWATDARRRAGRSRSRRATPSRARESFNRRFWFAGGGYLYDVVDGEAGDDPACRPNQVLAISLDHPVLDRERWEPVLEVVRERLLTPVGLRSLAPGHPDYKAKYYGDLRSRDAAYHQGTVWGWLIGPFVDAWLKTCTRRRPAARGACSTASPAISRQACVGSISEIFDAEAPYTPRGCIAQAWSVAEVLRCLEKTGALQRARPRSAAGEWSGG